MYPRITLLMTLLVILCGHTSTYGLSGRDTASFKGEITYSRRADTVIVHFSVVPYNFDADSIMLRIQGASYDETIACDIDGYDPAEGHVIIYRRADSIPFRNDWRSVERDKNATLITGDIPVPVDGRDPQKWTVYLEGIYHKSDGKVRTIRDFVSFKGSYFGVGSELFTISYGYFKSDMAAPFDKEGPFLAWGISAEVGVKKWRFRLSTSWSGFGKNFRLAEPVRLATRFYTGTRDNFMPQFYAAVKQSELMLKRDDFEYKENPWGGEFGIALEGPFERLGYHYSTAFNGYHTTELFMSFISTRTFRFGTRFQFIKYDELWAVKVALNFEGWHVDYDHFLDLARNNDRPLPHKILALTGMAPYLIISVPYNLFTGKPILGG